MAGRIVGNTFTPLQAPGVYRLFITQAETPLFTSAAIEGRLTLLSTLPDGYVARAGLSWTPLSTDALDWPSALARCTASPALGRGGWRLPTLTELNDYDFSVADRRDRIIWTSTPAVAIAPHDVVLPVAGHHMAGWLGLPRGNFSSAALADTEAHQVLCVNTP